MAKLIDCKIQLGGGGGRINCNAISVLLKRMRCDGSYTMKIDQNFHFTCDQFDNGPLPSTVHCLQSSPASSEIDIN